MAGSGSVKSIKISIPINHGSAETFLRLEHEGDDVLVSPLLGTDWLCENCWLWRRAATYNPDELCPDAKDSTDLITAFENKISSAGRPTVLAQRSVAAKLIRKQVRIARGLETSENLIMLFRVNKEGYVRTESVLPMPNCESCWNSDNSRPQSGLEHAIGRSGGLIAELQEVAARKGELEYPYVVITRLSNNNLSPSRPSWKGASGKGETLEAAIGSAIGESIERYAAETIPGSLIKARENELENAIVPLSLTGMKVSQAMEAGFSPYEEIAWVMASSVEEEGRTKWVPASAVYLTSKEKLGGHIATPCTSNGLATGFNLKDAIDRAYTEVIERHMFFLVWYGVAKAELVDAELYLDKSISRLFGSAELNLRTAVLGCDNEVYYASATCWPKLSSADRPEFTLGLGSGPTIQKAVASAVLELAQVYRGLSWALQNPSLRKRMEHLKEMPFAIKDSYDHALLYASRPAVQVPSPFGLAPPPKNTVLLRSNQGDDEAFFVDITPRDVLEACGCRTVRLLAPGRIPLHIGSSMLPKAILDLKTETAQQLSALLHPLS
ncbi:MAG: YcaO-like family protein [Arenicellales bacterium]